MFDKKKEQLYSKALEMLFRDECPSDWIPFLGRVMSTIIIRYVEDPEETLKVIAQCFLEEATTLENSREKDM